MKERFFILFIVAFINTEILAQDDNLDQELYSSDTVFILLKNPASALKISAKATVNPGKKYPEDKSRVYILNNSLLAFNTYFTDPSIDIPFFSIKSKYEFESRSFFTDKVLSSKSAEELKSIIEDKVLMIVDPTFATEDNYYLVRVFRYAGEE
ncbi:MAG: hypothetical protein AAF600_09570 [Bacteroidota bacterium]